MEIGSIKLAFGKLLDEINAKIGEAQEVDEVKEFLAQKEVDLRTFEKDLQDQKAEIDKDRTKVREEGEYNEQYLVTLKEKEIALQKARDALVSLKDAEEVLRVKKEDIENQMRILEGRKSELKFLDKRAKELEEREALVKKNEIIAEERKLLLDAKEEKVQKEMKRLQLTDSMI